MSEDNQGYSVLRIVIPSEKNINELMEELWAKYPGASITPLKWAADFKELLESDRDDREERRKVIKGIEAACKQLRREWL